MLELFFCSFPFSATLCFPLQSTHIISAKFEVNVCNIVCSVWARILNRKFTQYSFCSLLATSSDIHTFRCVRAAHPAKISVENKVGKFIQHKFRWHSNPGEFKQVCVYVYECIFAMLVCIAALLKCFSCIFLPFFAQSLCTCAKSYFLSFCWCLVCAFRFRIDAMFFSFLLYQDFFFIMWNFSLQ